MAFGIVQARKEGRDEVWRVCAQADGRLYRFFEQSLARTSWGAIRADEVIDGLEVEFDLESDQARNVRRYAPVPNPTRQTLFQHGCEHPGLILDKFLYRWTKQESVRGGLQKVVAANQVAVNSRVEWYEALHRRWEQALRGSGADLGLRCETAGRLTLHLSRAAAAENAGICLHPLYGFVYLPGTGLKGMARAYAETVWRETQSNPDAARRRIETVFGNEPGEPAQERQSAGAVVFHDAWPERWPRLVLDIVNNHHRDYYDGQGPPGDWETPTMVSFLAVPEGEPFVFPLAKRRSDVADELLTLAHEWLFGALAHEGAGAKTAAGYGRFKPCRGAAPANPSSPKRLSEEYELELVTPAFLAGAHPYGADAQADCQLRPATLRGLLRWWWRTLHSGFVDTATLRAMEAAVWGDTKMGGAVRLANISDEKNMSARLCDFKEVGQTKSGNDILNLKQRFRDEHGIIPAPHRTTQGLFYASYGVDELQGGDARNRRTRYFVDAGAKWKLQLTARPSRYADENKREHCLDGQAILEQAKAALWLLCYFGGVGSKHRDGFGSLTVPTKLSKANYDLNHCKEAAKAFRQAWGLTQNAFDGQRAESPALEHLIQSGPNSGYLELKTPWTNYWFALDQVGAAAQAFAQAPMATGHGKHCAAKAALGLPRQIHGPLRQPLPHQNSETCQSPEPLTGPKGERHAAPVFYHLARQADGHLIIRVCAFKSKHLPDFAISEQMLGQLLNHVQQYLEGKFKEYRDKGQKRATSPTGSGRDTGPVSNQFSHQSRQSIAPSAGDPIEVAFRGPCASGRTGYVVERNGRKGTLGSLPDDPAPDPLPAEGAAITGYYHSGDLSKDGFNLRWNKPVFKPPPPKPSRQGKR